MKNLLLLFFLILSQLSIAQQSNNLSVFHRLLIYNTDQEIMLVKIKDTDVWVTPGFYQDSVQFIKEGLHRIAATYGMTISNPVLKGTFSMRRERGERKEMLIRNIYTCNYLSGAVHFPENQSFSIGEIKWQPMEETLKTLSHISVRTFLTQIHNNPEILSGGSIVVYNENKEWKIKIIEEFYPLFSSKKRKRRKKKTNL